MNKLFEAIDKRRFWSNVAGYLIVFIVFTKGPEMTGFMGKAVAGYLWFYPIYWIGMLIFKYQRHHGKPL